MTLSIQKHPIQRGKPRRFISLLQAGKIFFGANVKFYTKFLFLKRGKKKKHQKH